MTFYDIFTYLCTFTIIIPLAVFCLFPVIDHLKTPIRHLLIKISLVFVCYFVLLIIPYMIFQQDLGNILIFLAVPVFFYLFQKETNLMLPASLFVMLTACCLGSLFLCYLSYIRCHLSSTWTKYRILSRIHDRTTDLSGFRRYHLI